MSAVERLVIGRSVKIAKNKLTLTSKKKIIKLNRLKNVFSGLMIVVSEMSCFITLYIPQ